MKVQAVCSFHGGKAKRASANAQAAIERADLQLRGLTVPAVDALKRLLHPVTLGRFVPVRVPFSRYSGPNADVSM